MTSLNYHSWRRGEEQGDSRPQLTSGSHSGPSVGTKHEAPRPATDSREAVRGGAIGRFFRSGMCLPVMGVTERVATPLGTSPLPGQRPKAVPITHRVAQAGVPRRGSREWRGAPRGLQGKRWVEAGFS